MSVSSSKIAVCGPEHSRVPLSPSKDSAEFTTLKSACQDVSATFQRALTAADQLRVDIVENCACATARLRSDIDDARRELDRIEREAVLKLSSTASERIKA
ncbi:MAG: hypothetical protein ACK56I_03675, partial [bacterium]